MTDRDFYRINYSLSKGPTINIDGQEYPILNLSEGGIKLSIADSKDTFKHSAVDGFINFGTGENIMVTGEVIRSHNDKELVLHLSKKIPYEVILNEQCRLLKENK